MEKKSIPPEVREYMRDIGGAKTPAKMAASLANMAKAREARRTDPMTLVCTCTGGASLKASSHKTSCPRGRLLYQRARAAIARGVDPEEAMNQDWGTPAPATGTGGTSIYAALADKLEREIADK